MLAYRRISCRKGRRLLPTLSYKSKATYSCPPEPSTTPTHLRRPMTQPACSHTITKTLRALAALLWQRLSGGRPQSPPVTRIVPAPDADMAVYSSFLSLARTALISRAPYGRQGLHRADTGAGIGFQGRHARHAAGNMSLPVSCDTWLCAPPACSACPSATPRGTVEYMRRALAPPRVHEEKVENTTSVAWR